VHSTEEDAMASNYAGVHNLNQERGRQPQSYSDEEVEPDEEGIDSPIDDVVLEDEEGQLQRHYFHQIQAVSQTVDHSSSLYEDGELDE